MKRTKTHQVEQMNPAAFGKMFMPRQQVAYSVGTDAANRSMREAGRTAWSREDYNEACREYERINPSPAK